MQPIANQGDNLRPDPHSYFRTDQPRLQHIAWTAVVHVGQRMLTCVAELQFDRGGPVDLDTRDLRIHSVQGAADRGLPFECCAAEPVIGSRLHIDVPAFVPTIWITYETSPTASALQWLAPEQTQGKQHPFLFSQGECLHTRSFLPCQDSPGVRFTYEATLTVPEGLRGLMAATHVDREVSEGRATERWRMDHPIPAYLMAFAVGDLVARDLSERSRVWAEPALVNKAAWEFADAEQMIVAAERLFGGYPWGRFDILVLPPSFPYGGMENPTLVFLTPAVLAGDRSAVNVVAHELAHGWTGNLVTNATWSDFWLNEGWTTYAEMRILEQLYGRDASELQAALLRRELDRDLARFAGEPKFTHLWPDLPGTVDPDDTFSRVPYCKGYLFLRAIEERVGRAQFDVFVRAYISTFGFRSIDTAAFLNYVDAELLDVLARMHADEWVYGPGIPDNAPTIHSKMRDGIDALAAEGTCPWPEGVADWNGAAWTYYLESLPRDSADLCGELDRRFHLSAHGNAEIQCAWYLLAIESGATYDPAGLEQFLAGNGRVKYLRPLYTALAARIETLTWALGVFAHVKGGYHPIAVAVINKVLTEAKPTA